jgi:hypothetical protein
MLVTPAPEPKVLRNRAANNSSSQSYEKCKTCDFHDYDYDRSGESKSLEINRMAVSNQHHWTVDLNYRGRGSSTHIFGAEARPRNDAID